MGAIAVGLLITLSYFFYQRNKNTSATRKKLVSELIVLAKSQVSSFEGTYLSGSKENGHFWVEIIIKPTAQQGEYQIEVKSKELKGYACCELRKNGILRNDTIFVQTTEWKRPVTMTISKNKSSNILTIGAIEKQNDDRFALSYYCCGGKSLMGEYAKSNK